jgi:hypothetical protein
MKRTTTLVRTITVLGLLAAAILGAAPVTAASNGPPIIRNMQISVQPEYDDPRVMVTYQGEFKDGASFPQQVKFPAPLRSEIKMVCGLKPPNDEHLCQLYDTLTGSDDLTVSYTLPIPTYYLEYYWDGIKGMPDKAFTFKYVSPYAIESLEIEVLQPLKATNFNLVPPYASVTSDSLGMKHYHYVFNNVTAGQTISIDVSYTKPDNKPSVAKAQTTGTGTGVGKSSTALWIGLAILGAVGVGFFLLRRKPAYARNGRARGQSAVPVPSRREARAEARRASVQPIQASAAPRPARIQAPQPQQLPRPVAGPNVDRQSPVAAFCAGCGTKLAAGAVFCHSCGARSVSSA